MTRKKARLVVKGFTEIWGEDYWHMYSPTLGRDTLFACLAYAASHNLEIHQLDAVAAYLNSDLTEVIFLRPPDGIPSIPGTVWWLQKALYGLKQARLEWYCMLCAHIQLIGYIQSGHDPCLYVSGPEMFVVVYVNDLLVFAARDKLSQTKLELARCYKMCDLREAWWFLTMEITCDQTAWTISIDQSQYIWKIIRCFELDNVWPVSTPMAANLKLLKLESLEVDQCLYQWMLGSLMYVAIGTHPNIMFAVHFLSQHSIAPGEEHLNVIKYIYHYLIGTWDLRLIFMANDSMKI